MCPDDGDRVDHADTEPATISDGRERPSAPSVVLPEPGYTVGEVIGAGGMGEVVSAHDRRMERDVAIKRMRDVAPSADALGRFLREARIQARLDHPAVVPVHELGIDAKGRPYFTMKRLAGVTLADRLSAKGPIQPLLRAFADVCLAIEFAHSRDVIHRDLKPANVMLGDYGEVYVIDWGVARVLTGRKSAASGPAIDTLDDGTKAGDVLGTPGYMAPEQMRGEPVGPAADVYALGSILFEVLAGAPLHPRGAAAFASTTGLPQQSPAKRFPDRNIAPELDAACHAALAEDPVARPSARQLGDQIQRYLDGDRDVERRRTLAAEQLAAARTLLDSSNPDGRATAIHHAGRALALDPESTEAAQLVTSLIVEPPREMPPELVDKLEQDDRRLGRERLRNSVRPLSAVFVFLFFLPWMDVHSWTNLFAFYAVVGLVAALNFLRSREGPLWWHTLMTGMILAIAFSRLVGPFMLTPVVLAGFLLSMAANPWFNSRPFVIVGWLIAATIVPIALERLGLARPTWEIVEGGVLTRSAIYDIHGGVDGFALALADIFFLGALTGYAVVINRRARQARRDVLVQAWHLGKLLPAGRVAIR
jgi:serine/threonine-protein kinase